MAACDPGCWRPPSATLAADYFFLTPTYSFLNYDFGQGLRLGLFVLEGSFIGLLVARMRRARRRAEEKTLQSGGDQENLCRSEERFRSLVRNASDMIVVLDPDGAITYESPSVERVLG